jgi:hypothetical protein
MADRRFPPPWSVEERKRKRPPCLGRRWRPKVWEITPLHETWPARQKHRWKSRRIDPHQKQQSRRGSETGGFAFVPKPLPRTSDDIGVVSNRQPT